MRYHNPETGLEIELGELDPERRRLFESALEKFRKNTSWFAFEQTIFSYTSPIFRNRKDRAEVLDDPLFLALKDMWLQLGVNQGFVARDRNKTKARPARAHRTTRRGDVAAARQPAGSRRRGR